MHCGLDLFSFDLGWSKALDRVTEDDIIFRNSLNLIASNCIVVELVIAAHDRISAKKTTLNIKLVRSDCIKLHFGLEPGKDIQTQYSPLC